ncbi:MAG: histidine ammonia-lyase [Gammaproteobacteria bacterium]|nr:histidine ammonia-lyase [Gammaproteobacteria bacterium]
MVPAPIVLDGESLDLERFDAVARRGASCTLALQARARVMAGQGAVQRALEAGDAVYGVNTGFGDLASVRIAEDRLSQLQQRLILSHASGLGEPLDDEVVRGMLLLRANTLCRGYSGVRAQIVETLIALLNAGVLPVVPSRGSVGASGDLAPLAHLALPLLGFGEVRIGGRPATVSEGLRRAGLARLELGPKEGLALINGTQAMTSLVALSCLDARRLVRVADLVAALSTEALRGTDTAFDPRLHALREHRGQRTSAANLWSLMRGSAIRESHRAGDVRVQDPYSVRCAPQVHGAVRDVLADVEAKVAIEMNAVTDNPLVFPGDDGGAEILSGGNFHGQPMAFAADFLAIALAELASIGERRIEKLTNTAFSGLPPFLARDAGLNSGFMMAQVTAAALVAENKVACHPASIDSIPTSADKEDHVSMGMGAALKLRTVVANVRRVLAIELVAAAQGIDLLRPLRSSERLETVHRMVRERIAFRDDDREMGVDLELGIALLDDLDPVLDTLE